MGVFDIIMFGLVCAFFFGALVFYDRTKHSREKDSKATFENAKNESKTIIYLIFAVFAFIAIGSIFFGD
jgi:hypothetical protein